MKARLPNRMAEASNFILPANRILKNLTESVHSSLENQKRADYLKTRGSDLAKVPWIPQVRRGTEFYNKTTARLL